MIARILVPVDFSVGSAAALRYAEALGAFVGATSVKAIHVFTPQTATADALVIPPVGELMDERENRMHQFLDTIPTTAGITRKAELLLGFAADKIVEESKQHDLIVMGATGETDLLENLFGTVSTSVVSRAECPVLLVPKQATFAEYQNILYASNSISLSRRAVLLFMDFNELFHARVHFVHVNDEEGAHPGTREQLFAPLFQQPEPEFTFEIQEVEADSVQEGLKNYLSEFPIDLAVMVTQQRGFWNRLFNKSSTRQMVLHPSIPLLVLQLEG
ncbi:universal stress protein [Neolewinella lacunae]|uniref:Universal stress protein n=1 Tax=Neolewinella lacunae TaxID=1517758 RepID=A0A923TFA1_9BACT|nr:universal stress protein [Neolewinella lacunae]MBC6996777.1 universal stress protein [Neolewinella lacunae]MDN3637005.1 universal stress protein [Neolewinella lacunae]